MVCGLAADDDSIHKAGNSPNLPAVSLQSL